MPRPVKRLSLAAPVALVGLAAGNSVRPEEVAVHSVVSAEMFSFLLFAGNSTVYVVPSASGATPGLAIAELGPSRRADMFWVAPGVANGRGAKAQHVKDVSSRRSDLAVVAGWRGRPPDGVTVVVPRPRSGSYGELSRFCKTLIAEREGDPAERWQRDHLGGQEGMDGPLPRRCAPASAALTRDVPMCVREDLATFGKSL